MMAFDKIKKWLFGSEAIARQRAARHQPKVALGLATAESGDRQDDVEGLEVGGVIWPIEEGSHDAACFLEFKCAYATYDKKAKKVWLLDNEKGTRHPGALPLIVGDTVFPESDTGGRGLVVRTALYGDDGLKKNVFIPFAGKLVAHHEPQDPPINSTPVFDEDGRNGGFHYLTKVKLMVTRLCLGATDKLSEVFAPMFNFTRNGDGTPAHGLANFRDSSAMLSHEADGPLCPADDNQHVGGVTSDGKKIHSGGIDRLRALYKVHGGLASPKEFVNEQWESGSRDAFVGRVEEREDFKDFHINLCGKKAKGRKKWQEWKPKASPRETPPPPKDPTEPPPGDPREPPPRQPIDPGEPGRPVIDPGPIPGRGLPSIAFPTVTETPTNTGPAEEEQPSLRGLIVPDFDPPKGAGFNEAYSHGVGTQDEIWKRAVNFTQREFFSFLRGSHDVAQGVAAQDPTANLDPAKVLIKAAALSNFAQDANGQWYGKRGYADGAVQTLMPGGLEGHMAYKARNGALLAANHTLTRLLLNYKQGSYTINTYFAMGARITTSGMPASGVYMKLDYTDDAALPDVDIRTTDADGLDASTGRKLMFNGTELATGSSANNVTAASTLTANRIPVGDGARGLADTSLDMQTNTLSNLNAATFTIRAASSQQLTLGTNGEATSLPGNVTVGGTLASGAHTMAEQAAPSTPAAGHVVIYPKSDGLMYSKDDAGVETALGGGSGSSVRTVSAQFGGPGGSISASDTVWVRVPYTGTITKVSLLADATGSIVIDVWKDTYANYPPTVANTIAAAAKPTLSSANKSEDATLTGWTTAVTAGDVLKFNVDSVSGLTQVSLLLEITV